LKIIMINNSSTSTSTNTSTPALSQPSEQEDFEVIFPPPIYWDDDDGWDDDVLPPPPLAVSEDQMSVVSDEDLPAESNSQPTETVDEDLLVPPPRHTSLVSEVVEEVALCSESAATTAPEKININRVSHISCDNKQMSVNMCQQPIMKVSHLIRQRRRNTDKKYESRISDRLGERKDVHNNKSKECVSLILTTSSDDSMALQMNQLQQEHHRQISSSNNIVHHRSEFMHNHLCSSKQEKSQLFEERKSQKLARNKRRIGRFFNKIMSNILDETHCVVQCQ